eukprot:GHVR01124551.1.p1 GENE.GHVR01124551.1~~GHVR01124551.1.p1  ORF type:complete len:204 (+),score=94.97 GHVR01124551.1:183-794(+)
MISKELPFNNKRKSLCVCPCVCVCVGVCVCMCVCKLKLTPQEEEDMTFLIDLMTLADQFMVDGLKAGCGVVLCKYVTPYTCVHLLDIADMVGVSTLKCVCMWWLRQSKYRDIYINTHTHTHTDTHTHTHTHTHTQKKIFFVSLGTSNTQYTFIYIHLYIQKYIFFFIYIFFYVFIQYNIYIHNIHLYIQFILYFNLYIFLINS